MIEVELDLAPVQIALDDLAAATSEGFALESAAVALVELIRLGFNDGTDPWGEPWKPLSARSRSGQPLRDTGRLMNSIAFEISGDTAKIGTAVCYGVVHQYGATVKAGPGAGTGMCGYKPKGAKLLTWKAGGSIFRAKQVTIPPRPFMPIKDGQAQLPEAWQTAVLTALKDALQGATGATPSESDFP